MSRAYWSAFACAASRVSSRDPRRGYLLCLADDVVRVRARLTDDLPRSRLGRLDDRVHLVALLRARLLSALPLDVLEGYLLDALKRGRRPAKRGAEAFLAAIAVGALARRPSAGFGEDVRLRRDSMVASGLELDS
jgi:hypothetical protein